MNNQKLVLLAQGVDPDANVIKSFIGSEHNNNISSGMRNDPGTIFNNQLNYRKDMVD